MQSTQKKREESKNDIKNNKKHQKTKKTPKPKNIIITKTKNIKKTNKPTKKTKNDPRRGADAPIFFPSTVSVLRNVRAEARRQRQARRGPGTAGWANPQCLTRQVVPKLSWADFDVSLYRPSNSLNLGRKKDAK